MSTIDEIQSNIQEEDQELFDTLQSVFTLKSDITKIIENKNNQFLQLKEMLESIADYVKQEQHLRQVIAEKKVNDLDEIQRIFNAQNEAMSELYHGYYKAKEESDQKLEGFISDLAEVIGGLTSAHNQLIDVVKRDYPNFGNQIKFVSAQHKKIIDAIKKVYNQERQRTTEQTQKIDEFIQQTQQVKESESLSNINRSVTQRLNALINKIVSDNEILLTKGTFVKNNNREYYRVKDAMEEITRKLKYSRELGDEENYSDSLSKLLINTKQIVTIMSEDFNNWKDLKYEDIAGFNKKIDKYDGLSALNQEILNELNPDKFKDEFAGFNEVMRNAQKISNEKLKQFISDGINSYRQNPLGKFDYINGNRGLIDRTKKVANHVDYQSLHDPAHMNFARARAGYTNVLNSIHEEHLEVAQRRAQYAGTDKNRDAIINQEMQKLTREDFKNGRYTQPLIDYNDNLLKSAKLEKKSSKETSKNLEEAIKTTYSQIYAISHFDPQSKLLDKLRSQCKMLEDTKRDVDATLKDKKTIQLKDFLKNPLKAAGLGTLLTLLGAGGLFSFNKWKNMIKSQADKSGQLMYNNYLINASAGLPMGYGALDRVYNQGRTLYAISNGMVGFEAPTKMYHSLIKRVGGGMYGGAKDPQGLSAMAKYMTLPAQLYDINENTLADFANSMYKTNKMSSQDTLDTLNRVMNDAKRANVPMEKYIKLISSMATQMRHLGYNGRHAVGIMTHMINRGMRVEDAHAMQTSILGVQTNYSKNKSNAVYAVMTGQAGNMWAGILMNLKTHDANGDPIGNRQKMIGQQMKAELGFYQFGFSENPEMQRFLMAQKLQMMGFDRQRIAQLTDTAISGSDEDLGKLLEGFEEEDIAKTEKAADGLKRMAAELKTVGAQVSHWQKMKTDMTVAANKIAESLGSHHAAMQELSEMIHNQIKNLTPEYTEFIKKIGELPDKIKKFKEEHGELTSFILAHPVLALAGVLGGTYLGYRGLKALGKKAFSHWNDPKTGNSSSNNAKSNKKSSSKGGGKNSWWNKAKNGAKKAKGLFGKGKLGFLGGLATTLLLGNDIANASALDNYEEEDLEDKTEDELSVKFLQMFATGEAKARLRKSDGSPMEIYGETAMQTWLRNEIGMSAQGLISGGIFSAILLKKLYDLIKRKYSKLKKFPKLPPLPPLPMKEKLLSGVESVKDKLSMGELGSILKNEVKSSSPSIGIDGGKGKFGSTLKNTAKWSGAFNLISEFMDTDSPYTTSQKIARAGIDTAIDTPIYAVASKISPWLALGLPIASWGIGKITGTDPLAWMHEKAKSYFGLSSELDKYNAQFLETLFNDTEMDADSFLELCEKKDEQGKLIKEYMKKNGVDFDSMTEVEKKIFAEEIKSLGNATATLAQIMALAIIAAKEAQKRRKNPNHNGKKLKPWVEKTIEDWANSAFDDNDNIKWGEALVGIEWLIKKNYEIVQNPDASDEEKQKAQDLLGTLFNMRAVAKYKIGGEDHDEVVNEMVTGANESYADWIASGQATKKLPANMQIVLNDGYKASIQKTVDSLDWGFVKKTMEGSEFSFEDYFDEYIADYMGQWSGDFFNNKDLVKQAYIEAKSQKILEEANPDQVEDVGADSPLPEITNPIDSEGNEGTINGMTVYRQFDPRWADNVIAGSSTMREAGCGPTSFAMVASAHGSHYSPWQIAQIFAQRGIYIPDVGSDASKYPELAREMGFELIPTKDKDYVKQMLASGHRVVAAHGRGKFTKRGHHMVYAGLNQNGKLLIANPGRDESVYTEYDVDEVLNDAGGDIDWYVDTGEGTVIDGALGNLNLGNLNLSGLASYKPLTIKEAHEQSVAAYQKAIGFSDKNAVQGRIINGMYVDPNQSFVSIEELKKRIIAERNGEIYQSKELEKPPSEKEIKDSGEDAANKSVQRESEKKAKEAEEKRRVLQLAIQKQKQQEEQEKAKEADVAHLNVYGELKKGMSMADFHRELEEILSSMNFDPDTAIVDFD